MKKSTIFPGLLLILSIIFTGSCKKDDDDNTRYLTKVLDSGSLNEEYQWQGNQLQKINNYNSAGAIQSYQEFTYSDGKLTKLQNYGTSQKKSGIINNIGYRNLLSYHNNFLNRRNHLKSSGEPDDNTTSSYQTYEYLNGKVNKISYYTTTSNDIYTTNSYDTVEYNGTQVSKITYVWKSETIFYVTFTWSNDNIITEKYYSKENDNFILSHKYDYQYDEKINKYKAINNLPMFESEILSKNNQTSATTTSYYNGHEYTSAISIDYLYNSDNYPIQQKETDVETQTVRKNYSFEYR